MWSYLPETIASLLIFVGSLVAFVRARGVFSAIMLISSFMALITCMACWSFNLGFGYVGAILGAVPSDTTTIISHTCDIIFGIAFVCFFLRSRRRTND